MPCRESHIDECICVERRCFVEDRCIPSPWCRNSTAQSDTSSDNAHIVIPVVCHTLGTCTHQKAILRRLLLSLWAVRTALPVLVMTPNVTMFRGLRAPLLHHNFTCMAAWAAPYHETSFYKLHALQLVRLVRPVRRHCVIRIQSRVRGARVRRSSEGMALSGHASTARPVTLA